MDITVAGAGIIGCAAAAFLAEAGARVCVVDPEGVGGGASGRNSGIVQHPYDPVLAPLYEASVALHREVLDLPADPAGILLLDAPRDALPALPRELAGLWLDDAREAEPQLAPGVAAIRIDTGFPVGPRRATEAWAARARVAGARFVREGRPPADVTLLATGAWTTAVPVTPLWGVTATLALDTAPEHVLEEASVREIAGGAPAELFSLVTAAGTSVLGSSVSRDDPDVGRTADRLRTRARRFLPVAAEARVTAMRKCPRPQSPDGRPVIGRLDPRTVVCTGHGPWGISTGPATARLAADLILEDATVPPALAATRFGPAG